MKITICIGSSCHLKGSRQVIERLQQLIAQHGLQEKVELAGTFCMGNCQNGVCVTLDEEPISLSPETVDAFFEERDIGETGVRRAEFSGYKGKRV